MFKPLIKRVKREGLREIVAEAVWSWLWPPLLSAVIFVIGLFEDIPWTYLLTSVVLVFAAVSVGLLRFSEWISRQRVEHKLLFDSVQLNKDVGDNGAVRQIRLGVKFLNSADFPVAFDIDVLETSFDGNYPPKKPLGDTEILIAAKNPAFIQDHWIELPEIKNRTATGHIKYRVRYGRQYKLKYNLEANITVAAIFDENGDCAKFDFFGK